MEDYRVPAGTGIGHVHLKVSDIDRALAFYAGVLGFDQSCGWATRRLSFRPPATITTSD